MVVNFKAHKINQSVFKLTWTFTLIKKKGHISQERKNKKRGKIVVKDMPWFLGCNLHALPWGKDNSATIIVASRLHFDVGDIVLKPSTVLMSWLLPYVGIRSVCADLSLLYLCNLVLETIIFFQFRFLFSFYLSQSSLSLI